MAGKEGIPAIESNRPHAALDGVGIDLDASVFEIAGEAVPVVEAVAEGGGDERFGGDAGELRLEPGAWARPGRSSPSD